MFTVWSVHLSKLAVKHRSGRWKRDWLPLLLSDVTSALIWQEILVNTKMSLEKRLPRVHQEWVLHPGTLFQPGCAVQAQRGRPAATWCQIHRDLQPGHLAATCLLGKRANLGMISKLGEYSCLRVCCSCLHHQGILCSLVMERAWRPSRGKKVPSSYLSCRTTFTWDLSDWWNEAINQ